MNLIYSSSMEDNTSYNQTNQSGKQAFNKLPLVQESDSTFSKLVFEVIAIVFTSIAILIAALFYIKVF